MSDLVGVEIEERDGVVVARLGGELDIAEAGDVGERILDAVTVATRGVIVDLSGLTFMDSSGVSMLFSLARRVASRRQELRVVAPSDGPVARVLELVGFDRAAPVHEDIASASGSIG